MEDQELEHRLAELRESWRVPRDPPLADMWQVIESRAFGPGRTQGSRWIRTLLPMAATLVLGFGLGQLAPELVGNRPSEPVGTAAQPPPEAAAPFVGIATNYLERVTALLVTLTDESRLGRPLDYSNERARDLLATTRLLLDSPGITDPHLRDLLDDLELVLAQIVRLPLRAAPPDVYLIDQALDQREVLPRLRVMLAENPTSEP